MRVVSAALSPMPGPLISMTASTTLHAALSILQTLEAEVRITAAKGSKEELAANALHTRATEVAAQLARLEMDMRVARLQPPPEVTKRVPLAAVDTELRTKLAQAEKDVKAYKARARSIEGLERSKAQLTEQVADLQTQLLASEAGKTELRRDLEDTRRRAVVAVASAEALKVELKRDIQDKAANQHRDLEMARRLNELERELQAAQLERATVERRAEVCEAELVETLAKVYTLEREKASAGGFGDGQGHLREESFRLVDACLQEACEIAANESNEVVPTMAAFLEQNAPGLGTTVVNAALHQLRTRLSSSPTERLERPFLLAVRHRGGQRLVRSLLVEADVVEHLSERLWRALEAMA